MGNVDVQVGQNADQAVDDALKQTPVEFRRLNSGKQPAWSTVKLSGEIVEGADVEVRKLVLYYKELPQGYLPSDGIVPHFYWEGTIRVIPAELYV